MFYYVLAQPRQAKNIYAGYLADQQYVDSYDDTFYGTKIDAYFDDNNILDSLGIINNSISGTGGLLNN